MHVPGRPSLFFLFFLLALMPWMAIRSAQRVRTIGTAALPKRSASLIGTMFNLAILLFLSVMAGRDFGYPFFATPRVDARSIVAAIVALAACFGLRAISQSIRSEDERRKMFVYQLAPRTAKEWALWTITVLIAGVAEEVAYRGVGMSILTYAVGNPWLAALICAIAFAVAHAVQGWKSGVIIFAIALVAHALVAFTGTLVYAIVVHIIYDLAAGYLISREAERRAMVPSS